MFDDRTQTALPTFDRPSLLERVDGDDELVTVLIQVFLDDAPRSMQAIDEAFAALDMPRLRLAAHALKGAAANISAETLRFAAGELERAAQEERVEDATVLVAQVRDALDALVPVLSAEVGQS